MVLLVGDKISQDDLEKAKQDYGDYVKVVLDVETEKMTIGGEWHADGEKILLEKGSKQGDIWGGGIDLFIGRVETLALINLRPEINPSQEILDGKIRERFVMLVSEKFAKWIGNKH
jgi:hypothetical protein